MQVARKNSSCSCCACGCFDASLVKHRSRHGIASETVPMAIECDRRWAHARTSLVHSCPACYSNGTMKYRTFSRRCSELISTSFRIYSESVSSQATPLTTRCCQSLSSNYSRQWCCSSGSRRSFQCHSPALNVRGSAGGYWCGIAWAN